MERNRTRQIGLATSLVLTTLFLGCCVNVGNNLKAKAKRTEELSASVGDATSLAVTTNVGTIKLESADVAEITVFAEITVRSKNIEEAETLVEEVEIKVKQSGSKLAIEAIKPSHFGRNQLSTDLTITAPPHLALQCTTNVGDIRTTGFTERVSAKTDVGSIRCTGLRGAIDLHTNVGDIKAAYAQEAAPALQAKASTNVGSVDFAGPERISARLSARVNVGSIDTDRPLTVTGPIKKSIQATLGEAEGQITLHTNVGSIKIR